MAPKGETEVLVVGAGPVGLFTALLLADQGVRVRIVDEEFRTAAHSYALALHPGSLQLLDQAGVTADLLRQGHRVETVAFYEGSQRRGELKLAKLGGDFPYVLVMPQSVLEGLLERRLRERGVKVQWNHRVTALQPEESYTVARIDKLAKAPCGYAVATMEWVTEKTLETAAPFVVGADGHRSIVRHTLGIDYEPVGPAASFAVFEFHSDADLASEVRIVLGEQTTAVLWQMLGGRFRWSFQVADRVVSAETRL